MKTYPRKPVLRKIALRREKADRLELAPSWARFISVDPPTTVSPGCSALYPGKRILTPREMEILRLVARGETDQGIAERLYLSRRTVSSHVSHILSKLDVPSRRAAVVTGVRLGLL